MQNWPIRSGFALIVAAALLAPSAGRGELNQALVKQFEDSQYVFIASTRKDGTLGKPAEIWFMYSKGAVYVASETTTWRVRRVKAGRPQVRISVGKPDGLSFMATGQIINDRELQQMLMKTFAEKYSGPQPRTKPWPEWADEFRTGFEDGTWVLIKYTPD